MDKYLITIEYCSVWHFTDRAVSLTAELLQIFEPNILAIKIVPSDSGRYEISIDGELLFSKLSLKRHANKGEIKGLVESYIMKGKKWV
jgi:selenoprotein W-related protein